MNFEQFIATDVSSGWYISASEVIRTALRLLEADKLKKEALNDALSIGEMSGFEKNFDAKAHLKKINASIS